MSTESWSASPDVAQAVAETAGMTRERLTARLTFLAPELTDDALRGVVVAAMTAPKRPLDGKALAEAQREREAPSGVAAVFGRWPGDESDEEVAQALEEIS
jgi:hypothetical protein